MIWKPIKTMFSLQIQYLNITSIERFFMDFLSCLRTSSFSTTANNFVFFVFNFRFNLQQNEVCAGFWFGFASNFHLYVEYGFYFKRQKQPPEVFYKKSVLKNFVKFTASEHQCRSLFFDKVADFRPATLLKKIVRHWYFPVNFAKFY